MKTLNGRQQKSRLARNVPQNFHQALAGEIGHIPSTRKIWDSVDIDNAFHWEGTKMGFDFWQACYLQQRRLEDDPGILW